MPPGGKELTTALYRVWRRLFDAGLAALESISPGKGIYYGTLGAVCYLAKRTSQGSDQLHGFYDRFFSRLYSVAFSFPRRGVTGTAYYRFEYNLHFRTYNSWKHPYDLCWSFNYSVSSNS